MGKTRAVLLYLRLSWIFLTHALFLALLLARVLRGTGWNWFLVFIPLFFFDILSATYYVLYIVAYVLRKLDHGFQDEGSVFGAVCFPRQNISLLVLVLYGVGLPVKFAGEILLCLALESLVPHFVPGILFSLLFLELVCVFFYHSLRPTIDLLLER